MLKILCKVFQQDIYVSVINPNLYRKIVFTDGIKWLKNVYAIDEEKAVWVRRIFDWYVNENRSLQWIAKELTRLDVPKDH
ncbi:MAG: recombinase family protein, partial [Planctomycetaceae bacterium]|nr:recombinase family protein [Planctomycetaceae bacterium]